MTVTALGALAACGNSSDPVGKVAPRPAPDRPGTWSICQP
jgi:hypothetical protein